MRLEVELCAHGPPSAACTRPASSASDPSVESPSVRSSAFNSRAAGLWASGSGAGGGAGKAAQNEQLPGPLLASGQTPPSGHSSLPSRRPSHVYLHATIPVRVDGTLARVRRRRSYGCGLQTVTLAGQMQPSFGSGFWQRGQGKTGAMPGQSCAQCAQGHICGGVWSGWLRGASRGAISDAVSWAVRSAGPGPGYWRRVGWGAGTGERNGPIRGAGRVCAAQGEHEEGECHPEHHALLRSARTAAARVLYPTTNYSRPHPQPPGNHSQ